MVTRDENIVDEAPPFRPNSTETVETGCRDAHTTNTSLLPLSLLVLGLLQTDRNETGCV